jgi:hypothetical protein
MDKYVKEYLSNEYQNTIREKNFPIWNKFKKSIESAENSHPMLSGFGFAVSFVAATVAGVHVAGMLAGLAATVVPFVGFLSVISAIESKVEKKAANKIKKDLADGTLNMVEREPLILATKPALSETVCLTGCFKNSAAESAPAATPEPLTTAPLKKLDL